MVLLSIEKLAFPQITLNHLLKTVVVRFSNDTLFTGPESSIPVSEEDDNFSFPISPGKGEAQNSRVMRD
jgi:hypothetical protein